MVEYLQEEICQQERRLESNFEFKVLYPDNLCNVIEGLADRLSFDPRSILQDVRAARVPGLRGRRSARCLCGEATGGETAAGV